MPYKHDMGLNAAFQGLLLENDPRTGVFNPRLTTARATSGGFRQFYKPGHICNSLVNCRVAAVTNKSENGQKMGLLKNIETKDLTPSGDRSGVQLVDLRAIGFTGYVSDAALNEIELNEVRANLVLTTATKFAFR